MSLQTHRLGVPKRIFLFYVFQPMANSTVLPATELTTAERLKHLKHAML